MTRNWQAHSSMTLREKVVFYIIWSIMWTISLLPFSILYLISDCAYFLVYRVIKYRRKVIDNNLKTSFPEKSASELEEIKKKFYRNFCDILVETIKLASASRESISSRVVYKNLDLISKAVSDNHGVTLYLGHYCNWEWITTIGLHVPECVYGGQVYHVLESKVMDKLMLRLRDRIGPASIPMPDIMRRMIRVRQEGKFPVIGFISDQSPIVYNPPYWIEFLHHNTPFISGTEKLARKLHQTCLYLDVTKVKRGHYEVDIQLMCFDASETSEGEMTRLYAALLEKSILRNPEYWLWSHNRWKRRREEFINDKENKLK